MMELQNLIEKSSRNHAHLCPRQILGVRVGLAGLAALGFDAPPDKKRLLVIAETDGCFVSGVMAATDCAVHHRTLRVVDYGKVAAVFVDAQTGRAARVAPSPYARERAWAFAAADEQRRYFAQMRAYQVMPADELLTVTPVQLLTPVEAIVSRPGLRVNCDVCGEEIMNEREVRQGERVLCLSCAGERYYE